MQNVAQAYLQTQVGTTGQGEIVVMLFDGALRFLAQAREKMEAKDYAAKGLLISRALDIINELDSSLNMDLGGELATNLHQLYFLCTTRLLQANLKLDMTKLDSVVEILGGLRSAFAQIITTPEAQAACARLGAKQTVQPTSAPRALSAPRPTTTPRTAAAGLYNQQEKLAHGAPAPTPPGVPGLPTGGHSWPAAPAMQPQVEPRPTAEPAAVAANPGANSGANPVPAAPAEPDATPQPVMSPAPAPSKGFAGKRLSLYGKTMQSR